VVDRARRQRHHAAPPETRGTTLMQTREIQLAGMAIAVAALAIFVIFLMRDSPSPSATPGMCL